MKQTIIKIGVIIIGSILVLATNSFASREMRGHHNNGRGGYYHKYGEHQYKWHHYRPGRGLWHKQRLLHRQPVYRHGHPGRYYTHPHRIVVKEVNNYYNGAESYAYPQDEFNASVSVSDSGFSFSIGVSETD